MKRKRNAILKYIAYWVASVGFGLAAYYVYISTFNELFIDWEVSFYFGVVFGLAAFMSYILLIDAFAPIVKYIIARIRKKHSNFIDILVAK